MVAVRLVPGRSLAPLLRCNSRHLLSRTASLSSDSRAILPDSLGKISPPSEDAVYSGVHNYRTNRPWQASIVFLLKCRDCVPVSYNVGNTLATYERVNIYDSRCKKPSEKGF